MHTNVVTMQYCCFTCLQELPPFTTEQNSKPLQNLQWNEDLAKTYRKNTGIVINSLHEYSKQFCQNCYDKLRAFDDFCETALDCSTALSELLLEEDFSSKTLKNLQHFCSTCLCQMNDNASDSLHLNNRKVKRWLHEYNKLKIRTATEYWPNSICQRCCKKIDEFLEFQYTAKQSFKQIDKTSNPQQSDIENTSKEEYNNHLSNQDTECLEETNVSTSYIMENKVNVAKIFCNAQKDDKIGSLILDNNQQPLEKHCEVDSVENNVFNQHCSTEHCLTKQCNKETDIADLITPPGSRKGHLKSLPTISITPKSLPKAKNQNSKYLGDQTEHTNKTDKNQNHLLSPSSQKGFQCNHCRKIFKAKTRLKRHKRYSIVCSSK